MKFIKEHFGFILPVFLICFSFEFIILINKITDDYEKKLYNDYSIIVVSKNALDEKDFQNIQHFNAIKTLNTDEILSRLKKDISNKNLNILKNILPNFYALSFDKLLNSDQANKIKTEILKINGVNKVETFSKTSDKIYKLLMFIRFICLIFLIIISLLCFVVFLKQIRLWMSIHSYKFEIMDIYGASESFKSGFLYRMIFIDCLLCFLLMLGFFYNIDLIVWLKNYLSIYEIVLPKLNYLLNSSIICVCVFFASILGVKFVKFKSKIS